MRKSCEAAAETSSQSGKQKTSRLFCMRSLQKSGSGRMKQHSEAV